jgi:hypothetical protein
MPKNEGIDNDYDYLLKSMVINGVELKIIAHDP